MEIRVHVHVFGELGEALDLRLLAKLLKLVMQN